MGLVRRCELERKAECGDAGRDTERMANFSFVITGRGLIGGSCSYLLRLLQQKNLVGKVLDFYHG